MAPVATISLISKIGGFFSKLGPYGITIIILLSFIGLQVLMINKSRNQNTKLTVEIAELKLKKQDLIDELDYMNYKTKNLQERLQDVNVKNRKMGDEIDTFRQKLKTKPLPTTCPDVVSETRETNTKAIELWKK